MAERMKISLGIQPDNGEKDVFVHAHFLKVAPVSCAIAPSVVCAALRPSRKSL
jgi:hypothetical protein